MVTMSGSTALVADLMSERGVAGRGAVILTLLAVTTLIWAGIRLWASRFRPVRGRTATRSVTSADLTGTLGSVGTFVQFSAATCATCPQVRRLLAQLAADHPGLVHIDLMAPDHLDLVRRFAVFRTPTVLLLDAGGAVRYRSSGPVNHQHAAAAVHQLARHAPKSLHA